MALERELGQTSLAASNAGAATRPFPGRVHSIPILTWSQTARVPQAASHNGHRQAGTNTLTEGKGVPAWWRRQRPPRAAAPAHQSPRLRMHLSEEQNVPIVLPKIKGFGPVEGGCVSPPEVPFGTASKNPKGVHFSQGAGSREHGLSLPEHRGGFLTPSILNPELLFWTRRYSDVGFSPGPTARSRLCPLPPRHRLHGKRFLRRKMG